MVDLHLEIKQKATVVGPASGAVALQRRHL